MSTINERTLEDIVRELAAVERQHAELAGAIEEGRQAVMEAYQAANREEYEAIEELAGRVQELRQLVRELALDAAERTGEKKPAPGITVRTVTRLRYREADAIAWATEQARLNGLELEDLLAVRKRPVEKMLRAVRPQFVEMEEERQVTFASNLAEMYLGGGE